MGVSEDIDVGTTMPILSIWDQGSNHHVFTMQNE